MLGGAQKKMRRAALFGCALLLFAGAGGAEDVSLSLEDARALATQAVQTGQPKLALQIAGGLLQANPRSSFAHYVMAHAYGQLGDPDRGRRMAAKAYRLAQEDSERFAAAELAAKMAYAAENPTLAQLWLRRTSHHAPSEQVEEQLGRDYARVRRENPLSFHLSGGLRPSSNINNGSDTSAEVIEDIPTGGVFRGSALALSGIVGNVSAGLSYRLRESKDSQTILRSSLYISRVTLSDEAAELAAVEGLDGSDFGVTYATLGLEHSFRVGETGSADLGFTLGQLWTGGDRYHDFARLEAARHWQIEGIGRLSLSGSVEKRDVRNSATRDAVVWSLDTRLAHRRENGDRVSLSFKIGETLSDHPLIEAQSASLSGRYSFAEQMGPVQLSLGLTLGLTDLDRYGSFGSAVRGRTDRSIIADASMFFPDIDYMGFAPTLSVKAGRKYSNFNRFDTKEFSVSLGIRSKF